MKNKKGFTLPELLIVGAIIGVLVAIAIPIFSSQLRKSRAAVDQANVRSAKAAAAAAYMTNGEEEEKSYFYDAESGTVKPESDGIRGYGKSTEELTGSMDDFAENVPKEGNHAHIVKVTIAADGAIYAFWDGGREETKPEIVDPAIPAEEHQTIDNPADEKNEQMKGLHEFLEENDNEWIKENEYNSKTNHPTVIVKQGGIIKANGTYYVIVSKAGVSIKNTYNNFYQNHSGQAVELNLNSLKKESDLPKENNGYKNGDLLLTNDIYYVYYNNQWQEIRPHS